MIYSSVDFPRNPRKIFLFAAEYQIHAKKVNPPIAQSAESIYINMHSANPRAVANATMRILDSLQKEPEDIQLAASGVILLTLSRRFDIPPATVLNCVDNLMKTSKRYDDATFKAVAEYFKNEL